MRVGIAIGERPGCSFQRPPEPGVEIAAVRERASLDDTLVVHPVHEQRRPGLGPRRLVDRPKGARGADHQRGALTGQTSRSEIGARSVEERRIPAVDRLIGDLGKPFGIESERVEQLLVPGAGP